MSDHRESLTAVKYGILFKFRMLLFLLVMGCAPAATSPPRGAVSSLPHADVMSLLGADQIKGIFKAIARIDINSDGGRYPLKVAAMLKLPSLMRIETLPVIGPPDFFLSTTNDALKVFMPAKQAFYIGRPSGINMALFFPLSLPPRDMVRIFMGLPPMIPDKNLSLKDEAINGERTIEVLSSDGKIILILRTDGTDNLLAGMEVFSLDGEKLLYRISYGEYINVGSSKLPQRIILVSKETDATMEVRYSDMELSQDADERLFDLALPPGITPIMLDVEDASPAEDR